MVEQAPRSVVRRDRDPASRDLIFPAGAAELLFTIEDPCSHSRSGPFTERITAGNAHTARVLGRRRRSLSSHNQPRRTELLCHGDDLSAENRGGVPPEP